MRFARIGLRKIHKPTEHNSKSGFETLGTVQIARDRDSESNARLTTSKYRVSTSLLTQNMFCAILFFVNMCLLKGIVLQCDLRQSRNVEKKTSIDRLDMSFSATS